MSRTSTDRRAPPGEAERDAPALSRATLLTVRRMLPAQCEGWPSPERLAAAAGMVAEDARHRGIPAERMLVALKRAWAALEEVRRMPVLDAHDLLTRLVTLCIRAFYAPVPPRHLAAASVVSRPAGARSAA
jgi:hypothetical protein